MHKTYFWVKESSRFLNLTYPLMHLKPILFIFSLHFMCKNRFFEYLPTNLSCVRCVKVPQKVLTLLVEYQVLKDANFSIISLLYGGPFPSSVVKDATILYYTKFFILTNSCRARNCVTYAHRFLLIFSALHI